MSSQIIYIANSTFISISVLAGITVYFREKVPLYLKLLPPFLLIKGVIELIGISMSARNINNHELYNCSLIFETSFFLYVLGQIARNKIVKKSILYAGLAFLISAILVFYALGIKVFNTNLYLLGSILIIFFSAKYLYELFKKPLLANQARQPGFWITSGLLLFYSTTLPYMMAVNFLSGYPYDFLEVMNYLIEIMDCILYCMIAVAFLYSRSD